MKKIDRNSISSSKGLSHILMPTDFQQSAHRAFLYAIQLAVAFRAGLTILHVIKVPADAAQAAPGGRYLRALKTAAMLDLGRATRIAREAGAHAEPLLLYGTPPSSIQEGARRVHADMIVMGTEGRTGWDRLRLGSAAQAVVQASPCPVLTVHGGLAGDRPRHPAKIHFSRLLAATDFSRPADAALRMVSGLAARFRGAVSLIHACETAAGRRPAEQQMAKRVLALKREGIEADGRCRAGDPVDVILSQAAACEADVIALGTRGRRGLNRVLLGSVAEAVLKRAGCPVLTVGRDAGAALAAFRKSMDV